jgi:hypothetical protein
MLHLFHCQGFRKSLEEVISPKIFRQQKYSGKKETYSEENSSNDV